MSLIGVAPPKDLAESVPQTSKYVTRLLPPAEWDRLRDLPFAANGLPDPSTTILFITERDGAIVGLWGIFLQPMLDGLWIHEDHRGHTPVAYQLLHTMKVFMSAQGLQAAFTQITDGHVMTLAHKAGFTPVPGQLWMLAVPRAEDL